MSDARLVIPLSGVGVADVGLVGGKNASLGEMITRLGSTGIRVPGGFATTATAYRLFVTHNALAPVIVDAIAMLHRDPTTLPTVGSRIRDAFAAATVPPDLERLIREAYLALCSAAHVENMAVAVRSSATAEDLPDASFAGQHESYLNVSGADSVVRTWLKCVTSMFTDRAISYREGNGFDHSAVALSVGVQRMVRSDKWGAGVMFTIDTESGFRDLVVIDGSWGLGEAVVKGEVDPDRYRIFKPLLGNTAVSPITSIDRGEKTIKIIYSDTGPEPTVTVDTTAVERAGQVLSEPEICALARWALAIEAHYGRPMDIEWAKDGISNELFILQARPETVHARRASGLVHYQLTGKGPVLLRGLSVGDGAAAGPVCRLRSAAEIGRFPDGGVLVAEITDPDWVPVMRRAAAIVTDRGGRTSHAAIVSRELGVPAVARHRQRHDDAGGRPHGHGVLRRGKRRRRVRRRGDDYASRTSRSASCRRRAPSVMLNLADPGAALAWWQLPADGIGLARMEFIVTDHIKVHPMALAHPERVTDPEVTAQIRELTRGYDQPAEYFVDQLRERHRSTGRAILAPPDHPAPVGLQDERVRDTARRQAVRTAGRESDARLARCEPLLPSRISRRVRVGVPGDQGRCASAGASPT